MTTVPGPARELLAWFRRCRRDLPWRRRRDAYTTWVSEVMLQQTTVDVVAPRFEAFLARFPDVRALALAPEAEVVAAWAGLGYYRRARSLKLGAEEVVRRHGGRIPDGETDLLSLPGVGPYTAGAIRALAFNLPAAAVDGNVARVMARVQGDDGDIASPAVRARFAAAILGWIPRGRAGEMAEALIELGALVCRPREPRCDACPWCASCAAFSEDRVSDLPVRRDRRATVAVDSVRAVAERGGRLLLVRRPADASLLPGFLELPGRWGPPGEEPAAVLAETLGALGFPRARVGRRLAFARHVITHHRIRSEAWSVEIGRGRAGAGALWMARAGLDPRRLTTETRKLLGLEAEA